MKPKTCYADLLTFDLKPRKQVSSGRLILMVSLLIQKQVTSPASEPHLRRHPGFLRVPKHLQLLRPRFSGYWLLVGFLIFLGWFLEMTNPMNPFFSSQPVSISHFRYYSCVDPKSPCGGSDIVSAPPLVKHVWQLSGHAFCVPCRVTNLEVLMMVSRGTDGWVKEK